MASIKKFFQRIHLKQHRCNSNWASYIPSPVSEASINSTVCFFWQPICDATLGKGIEGTHLGECSKVKDTRTVDSELGTFLRTDGEKTGKWGRPMLPLFWWIVPSPLLEVMNSSQSTSSLCNFTGWHSAHQMETRNPELQMMLSCWVTHPLTTSHPSGALYKHTSLHRLFLRTNIPVRLRAATLSPPCFHLFQTNELLCNKFAYFSIRQIRFQWNVIVWCLVIGCFPVYPCHVRLIKAQHRLSIPH